MISSDVIRGYNDTIILYLLQQNPSYGYEISKQIRTISRKSILSKRQRCIQHLPAWRKTDTSNLFPEMRQMESGGPITE